VVQLSSKYPRDPIIVDLYEQFLADQNSDTFVHEVSANYSVATLERIAVRGRRVARRGAVLALGCLGDYNSNSVLGYSLVDRDRGVRTLAENSIRKIWCRVGSPSERHGLELVSRLNHLKQSSEAIVKATRLIHGSPWLAEAWYQRGIGYFQIDDYETAVKDFRQALEINPYHFDAAVGMGQCYLKQSDLVAALRIFRRSLRLNPGLENVRAQVVQLQRALNEE
jgi:tetratricopeptide (TPR) repeat protein